MKTSMKFALGIVVAALVGTAAPASANWQSTAEIIAKPGVLGSGSQENSSLTISDHPGPATKLTTKQKTEIRAFLRKNRTIEALSCTGTILPEQTERMNQIVLTRAQLVCDFAQTLRPSLEVTHQIKTTKKDVMNGRVILRSR